jgi:hypothetical protein
MDKITWQELTTQVTELAGNKEQNAHIPPEVLSNAGRLATDYILGELVNIYPNSQSIVDKARPFLKRKIVNVENGIALLPSDYRNILSVGVAVTPDYSSPCECNKDFVDAVNLIDTCNPLSPLYDKHKASLKKEPCVFKKVYSVDSDQFDDRSRSKINPPTLDKPIYTIIDNNSIKVCPNGVTYVEIRYIKQPLRYNIGYKLMPDDTWQIDPQSPLHVEMEWERNVAPELFRAVTTLYSIHTRDGNLVQWNNELKKLGLF